MLNFVCQLIGLKPYAPRPVCIGLCSLCGTDVYSNHLSSPCAECTFCFVDIKEVDPKLIEEYENRGEAPDKAPLEFDSAGTGKH